MPFLANLFIGKRNFVFTFLFALCLMSFGATTVPAQTLFVEAESFETQGGWKLDTQFLHIMGSPYLLAHGLGEPVDDAVTSLEVEKAGQYRVWVRTKDWVAPFDKALGEEGAPGRFELVIGGNRINKVFGAEGAEWHWQEGGTVYLPEGTAEIRLHDLTGFDGRCDAILLTADQDFVPDNSNETLTAWRRTMLGQPEEPLSAQYDLVVVGGGYAGMGAAISASRLGLKVALIQNRPVLGGNGSSEIRVWGGGDFPGGLYPIGDIIREFSYRPGASPWRNEDAPRGDQLALEAIDAEENLDLFLLHHAFAVEMSDNPRNQEARRIASVDALDVRTGVIRRFVAPLFVDATGHGFLGQWAGAEFTMEEGERMGMSNMWRWVLTDEPQTFPETDWALDLDEGKFPYPRRGHAQWFWEGGFDKHPLDDLELIRDWNLCAAYGAWNAIKNKGAYADSEAETGHRNARMVWLAYVGGTRETLQILGDVVLAEEDITSNRQWEDAAVLSTWSIDLHYPNQRYERGFEENPFISRADFSRAPHTSTGYQVPYRCFYSRNVENLFTAGRCISVTHEALGTVRVMNTLGMVGATVGRAASICTEHDCLPRDVYEDHLPELRAVLNLPGQTRREGPGQQYRVDGNVVQPADPRP